MCIIPTEVIIDSIKWVNNYFRWYQLADTKDQNILVKDGRQTVIGRRNLKTNIPGFIVHVAQRDEALELATAARERGDEGAELVQTVRAIELDRPPLPQLSLGAWQLKERGIEVGVESGRGRNRIIRDFRLESLTS